MKKEKGVKKPVQQKQRLAHTATIPVIENIPPGMYLRQEIAATAVLTELTKPTVGETAAGEQLRAPD